MMTVNSQYQALAAATSAAVPTTLEESRTRVLQQEIALLKHEVDVWKNRYEALALVMRNGAVPRD